MIWNREGCFIYVGMLAELTREEPKATGGLALGAGSIVMPAGDEVAISSASMSLIDWFFQPSTTALPRSRMTLSHWMALPATTSGQT